MQSKAKECKTLLIDLNDEKNAFDVKSFQKQLP